MAADAAVLLLRLAGPMQAWGTGSRFTRRGTNLEPSKSGIVGLLAAAQGLRRTDPLKELTGLRLGIRVDQPGELMTDFQTAVRSEITKDGEWKHTPMPLSHRAYLADAVFLGVVEGPRTLVEQLQHALTHPVFPLALGRRSCPPAGRLVLGVEPGHVEEHLREHEWLAMPHHRRRSDSATATLATVRDAGPDDPPEALSREHDVPLSFDPQHRRFAWRSVVREHVPLPGATPGPQAPQEPDYLEEAMCF